MAKTSLSKDQVKEMLLQVADAIIAAEPKLSEADRNLGDGDHGLGMQRGMTAAKEKLNSADPESIEKVFSSVGMAMMSSMGGASGAIFGTYFRNGGKALAGKETFDAAGLAAFLQAGVDGVKQRGGAAVGDKTVVDAMQPAAERLPRWRAKNFLPLPLRWPLLLKRVSKPARRLSRNLAVPRHLATAASASRMQVRCPSR